MIIDVSISFGLMADRGAPFTVFLTRQPGLLIHRRHSAHKQRRGVKSISKYLLQRTGSIPNLRDLPHPEISDVLLILEEWDIHVICRNVASAAT